MFPVNLIHGTLFVCAAIAVDEAGRWIAALVGQALRQADVTQDYVSVVTGIPRTKLSEQLNGKQPFTSLARILSNPTLRDETDFHEELTALFARSINRALVSVDLGYIVARLDDVIGRPHPAKMALPDNPVSHKAVS